MTYTWGCNEHTNGDYMCWETCYLCRKTYKYCREGDACEPDLCDDCWCAREIRDECTA